MTDGTWSGWYNLGNWSSASTRNPDGSITSRRGSVANQEDATGSIDQDTYWAKDNASVRSYRVREVLHVDDNASPQVRQFSVVASDPTKKAETPTSQTTMRRKIDLPVPALSQYVHNGEYTQFDQGGAAWCSPTAVSMVLRYYRSGPTAKQIADLPPDAAFNAHHRVDGEVDYAAYHIFDNGSPEKNTGDWPFNTAYAASFGLDASVRQYNSLRDIEAWIKRGVPIIVTLKWDNTSPDAGNHLDGTSIEKTSGHLMVVRGFTENGDVIANDPASPAGNQQVRHVYNRAQFEHRWITSKHGTVYVIQR
ncbi:MAG TPA: C39 family peptidase [Mycobacteriales bacterium]|nr:C39 family peptidase [Mycobacteriales bacterium]